MANAHERRMAMLNFLLPVAKIVGNIVDQVVEDKDLNNKLQQQLKLKLIDQQDAQLNREFKLLEGQLAINLADAKSGSFWQAGWRPLVAWGCGLGLLLHVFVFPIAKLVAPELVLPDIDTNLLMGMLAPLLGLGGMRSFDKQKIVKAQQSII